jgi:hypothetical protein
MSGISPAGQHPDAPAGHNRSHPHHDPPGTRAENAAERPERLSLTDRQNRRLTVQSGTQRARPVLPGQ